MLCAEKLQRILMASVLGIALYFLDVGTQDPLMFQIGFVLQIFVIIMILVWAVTDFCPSIWFLKKIFGSCWQDKSGS